MWKYGAIAVVSLTIGLVASPIILRQLAINHINDVRAEALKAWSSDQKDWLEFSRFIEAGGRAYWKSNEVYNGLVKGMNEEDIRRDIGPPDAVLIGRAEISKSFKLGVQSVSASQCPRRPMDYIPYLHDETVGLYVYKMGYRAHDVSRIELKIMY